MIIHSYAVSYPWQEKKGPAIAVARGGNIIGGGDWSADRLIPDYVRAVHDSTSITLRYPTATRPWQHVLALVHGYLKILAGLSGSNPSLYARAWNLGPADPQPYSVKEVFEILASCWRRPEIKYMDNPASEANALALDSSLARSKLDWSPNWDTVKSIEKTAEWYAEYYKDPAKAWDITRSQVLEWRASNSK